MATKTQQIKTEGQVLARVAAFAAIFNLCLAASKYLLSKFSGSLSLQADAIHSLTDVIGSISVFLGLKFADRKSKDFPYGLYKLENLASLVTSFFIFAAAFEIIHSVISEESVLEAQKVPVAAGGLLAITIALWLFSRWELKIAKKSGSPSLAADAEHMKTDLFSSAIILIGLIGGAIGFPWLDHIAAIIISIFIIHTGWEIMIDSLKVLLDAGIEPEVAARIAEIIRSFPEVKEIKRLTGRRSGRFSFVEAEIILDVRTLDEAHEIVTIMEEEIYDQFPEIDRVVIHFEPPKIEKLVIAIPLDEKGNFSGHLACAPAFLIIEIDCSLKPGKVKKEYVLENPYFKEDRHRGALVAEWLKEKGVNTFIVPVKEPSCKGLLYALDSLGIKIYFKPEISLEQLKKDPPCPETSH